MKRLRGKVNSDFFAKYFKGALLPLPLPFVGDAVIPCILQKYNRFVKLMVGYRVKTMYKTLMDQYNNTPVNIY